MLLQSKQLADAKVMSLHTGAAVGQLGAPIINPHKLEIEAFYCQKPTRNSQQLILLTKDIREATAGKVLIDSSDELSSAEHLIRLQEYIDIKFNLIDKVVRTTGKRKLGKVDEYIIDTLNFEIQKLYVKQSLLKSFSLHTLVIDRSQIVEVTDRQIIVDEATIAKPEPVVAPPIAPVMD